MMDDESANINSELRYITLELMKLAKSSGRSFEEVAKEYIQNVYKLHALILRRERLNTQEDRSES